MTEKLRTYISRLKDKIDLNFHEFDELLAQEEKTIEALSAQWDSIHQRLKDIQQNLQTVNDG